MEQLKHTDLNIPKQLDYMLSWFCEPLQWRKSHTIEIVFKAVVDANTNIIKLNIDAAGIMNACLNKLMKDGYVEKVKIDVQDMNFATSYSHYEYRITYDGLVFNGLGGYLEQTNSLSKEKDWRVFVENATVQNGKKLNKLTWLLAIGTIGLLLFEIYKFCFENHFVFYCH